MYQYLHLKFFFAFFKHNHVLLYQVVKFNNAKPELLLHQPNKFTYGNAYVSVLLSQFIPSSLPRCVHEPVLYVCISVPAPPISFNCSIWPLLCVGFPLSEKHMNVSVTQGFVLDPQLSLFHTVAQGNFI